MQETTITRMVFPYPEKKGAFKKVPSYLIHQLDNDHFLIHRELSSKEQQDYGLDEMIQFEGKWYLFCIMTVSSQEKAEVAIEKFWQAFMTFPHE